MIRQHFYPKNYIRKKSQRKPTPEQNDHSLRNSHANTHYSVFSCTSSLHKRHMSLPVDSPKLVFYETGAVTEFLPNNNHELSSSSRL